MNSFMCKQVIKADYVILSMFQQLTIIILFVAALVYLGRMIYRSFQSKSCATGCGKCSAIDFEKIEKQVSAQLAVKKERV